MWINPSKTLKDNNNRQRVIQDVLGHTDVMIVRMCHKNSHHRGNGCQGERKGEAKDDFVEPHFVRFTQIVS